MILSSDSALDILLVLSKTKQKYFLELWSYKAIAVISPLGSLIFSSVNAPAITHSISR